MARDIGDLRIISTDEGVEFHTFGEVVTLSRVEVSKLISDLAYWLAVAPKVDPDSRNQIDPLYQQKPGPEWREGSDETTRLYPRTK